MTKRDDAVVLNWWIAGAIAATLISSGIFTAIVTGLVRFGGFLGVLFFVAYALIHPYIGRMWSDVALTMSNNVDELYGLEGDDSWGNWPAGGQMLFAAAWPLTALWCVVAGVALIYGRIFKNLFR